MGLVAKNILVLTRGASDPKGLQWDTATFFILLCPAKVKTNCL